ncbi:MAG: helix-turn-helix transcriptional regulator [Archangium sp.]|nr:helix-turn-helix transcriptional regulator [Archangium sp.]
MPSAVDLATFLLELHERSNELGYREFQHFALDRLARLIPFDSGLLAIGTIHAGAPTGRDVVLHRQPPEFMTSWDQVRHEDQVALWAFTHPNQTGNFAVDGPLFEGRAALGEHCRQWGLAHVMVTSMVAQHAGLYWVLSVYGADPKRPFTEAERAAMELVMPHVIAAARRARLGQLRARTAMTDSHGQAAAIVNDEGIILEAEPGFTDLLRGEFKGWEGPLLPKPVQAVARTASSTREVLGRLAVRADPSSGVLLLHLRRAVPADQLTAREREIAQAFSQGETHRELGQRLGVSPNTVRRHLFNIYEKLGISSKVELQKMISD